MYVRVTMNKNIVDNIYRAWGNIVSNHEGIIKHVCEILSSYLFIDLVYMRDLDNKILFFFFFSKIYIFHVQENVILTSKF